MNKEERELEIDLLQLTRALWKQAKYILLVAIVFGILGAVWSTMFVTPIYEASAKMIVNNRKEDSLYITNDQINAEKNLANTYAIIIRSRDVLNQVIGELNLTETYGELERCISVNSEKDAAVMKITVRHSNPATAVAVTAKILQVAPGIIVEKVEAGSVKTIEGAYVNPDPVSPSIVKNTILMGAIGFLLTCAVIAIIFLVGNTYNSDMDIQNDLNVAVLGVIPSVESCGKYNRYGYKYAYGYATVEKKQTKVKEAK